MLYHYTCNHCIGQLAGRPPGQLPVIEYNRLAEQFLVEIEHGISESPKIECSICGQAMRRIIGVQAAYIRGYGLKDKRGAKTDMNLYQMLNADPYKEHRKAGDARDLTLRLQQSKDHNSRPKRVFTR